MTQEEYARIKFTKRKKNLVLEIVKKSFEEELLDALDSGLNDESTLEDLDAIVDEKLNDYDELVDAVCAYYDKKMLGEDVDADEEDSFEEET